jgi:hypothetical protein
MTEVDKSKDSQLKEPNSGRLGKLTQIYSYTAIFVLNLVIAALLLNVIAAIALKLSAKPSNVPANPLATRYGAEASEKAIPRIYPDLKRDEVEQLLAETWGRPVAFHPFTLFKERPFSGKFVNVHEVGFRFSQDQAAWPPNKNRVNIFVFGGSTTFGYGVPDWQTIPSYLGESLKSWQQGDQVAVYNFGSCSFYSSQERAYFSALLTAYPPPDIVVFIDGLNEFFYIDNTPKYSRELSDLLDIIVAQKPRPSPILEAIDSLPLIQLARKPFHKEQFTAQPQEIDPNSLTAQDVAYFNRPEIIEKVISTYRANKRMIESMANRFNVLPLFVWQPVPAYNFDLRRHPFPKNCKKMFSAFGYPKMKELYEQRQLGENFLWAADLQTTAPDPIYLDMVHYTAQFNKILANTIAERVAPLVTEVMKRKRETQSELK